MKANLLVFNVLLVLLAGGMSAAASRTLTFEERVAAQREIERVHYSHQLGATRPFDEAVPRSLLEAKVREYLRRSAILEAGGAPVTTEALEREQTRIARDTLFPERLEQIYDALGHDEFLVRDCYTRATLVERVTPNPLSAPAPPRAASRLRAAIGETTEGSGSTCPAANSWHSGILEGQPSPRQFETVVWTGSELIVWGGKLEQVIGLGRTNTGSRYDPITDSWTPMSTVGAPAPRTGHAAVWTGEEMVVWGGLEDDLLDSGGRYDPVTDSWTPTSPVQPPAARAGHTAVWTGEEMVVWGGDSDPAGGAVFEASGGRYDPVTDSWTATSTTGAPSGRVSHGAVWSGAEMIVYGGVNGATTGGRYDPQTDSWSPVSTVDAPEAFEVRHIFWTGSEVLLWPEGGRYDPSSDSWATITTPSGLVRIDQSAAWIGDGLIVWGGYSSFGEVHLYTRKGWRWDGDGWSPIAIDGAPSERDRASAVWTGELLLIWGGHTDPGGAVASGHWSSTGGRYDPDADVWIPLAGASAAQGHTIVWTGNEAIVWGGGRFGVDTGARYSPLTDSWSSTAMAGAPEGRRDHGAVWTGDEMIVWGGWDTGFPLETFGDGARYDPIADRWSAMSDVGAPDARHGHTTVWTGGEMIVWGGHGFDSGGRYDPVADVWSPTSSVGAPAARDSHTAVWTGSEMIVWGGGTSLKTGGRYDPAADDWVATPAISAPVGRRDHTAVWSGSRMVVWGGSNSSGELANGGRYDPVANVWQSTELSGAPDARRGHTAVWAEGEMIIWGGEGAGALSSGGRYEPLADAWSATETNGAPPGREGHTAVWTGEMMIVWGGWEEQSGGRYFPQASADTDGDLFCAFRDCDDTLTTVWDRPGEVTGLVFSSPQNLQWTAPAELGGQAVRYATLRSETPVDFLGPAVCVEQDGADTESEDGDVPPDAGVFFYVVRAENDCPDGAGPLGSGSDGLQRAGRSCP